MTPGTLNFHRTDLYQIHHVVQNTLMSYPKELVIDILRKEFSKDSYYAYRQDEWGYPKVVDLTDVPLEAGYDDDRTTRIFIGEAFRQDAILYPALMVRMTSAKSVPISMSRNKETIEYEKQLVIDGYGNTKEFFIPRYIDLAGAWEGSISIDIWARDIHSRDNLISLLMLMFTDIRFETMRKAGVLIKSGSPSVSGVSEGDDRRQDKLYKATINMEVRSEWRRLIPVGGIVDRINFCVDFTTIDGTGNTNPNLQISQSLSILDQIEAL